jgi:hypothetical protein
MSCLYCYRLAIIPWDMPTRSHSYRAATRIKLHRNFDAITIQPDTECIGAGRYEIALASSAPRTYRPRAMAKRKPKRDQKQREKDYAEQREQVDAICSDEAGRAYLQLFAVGGVATVRDLNERLMLTGERRGARQVLAEHIAAKLVRYDRNSGKLRIVRKRAAKA